MREVTRKKVLKRLNEYGMVCLVRPTGWGKTYLLPDIIKHYKKVLYIYPNDSVSETLKGILDENLIKRVDFATYQSVAIMDSPKKVKSGYDLIITDECHRLGGDLTKQKYQWLLDANSDAHLLGLTATPERMDLFDVVQEYFGSSCIDDYTLHDAFNDGMLQRPYYCFATYKKKSGKEFTDAEKALKLYLKEEGMDRKSYTLVKERLLKISRLYEIDKILKDICEKYVTDLSYMRFICFFSTIFEVTERSESMREWFQTAFPDKEVNVIEIHSDSREGFEAVQGLQKRDGVIDLICCVDMLNMGYHSEDTTGIVMFRGTSSSQVYAQQLGRVLSSGDTQPKLVIDLVDNLHRKAVYRLMSRKRYGTQLQEEEDKAEIERIEALEKAGGTLTKEDVYKSIKARNHKGCIERFKSLKGRKDKMAILERKLLKTKIERKYNSVNDLRAEDLISTGNEASYRELITKCLAEPIAINARRALAMWWDAAERKENRRISRIEFNEKLIEDWSKPVGENKYVGHIPVKATLEAMNVSIEWVVANLFDNGCLAEQEYNSVQELRV